MGLAVWKCFLSIFSANFFPTGIYKSEKMCLRGVHCFSTQVAEMGAKIKNFNTQAQIAQPKFLIGKAQAQIVQLFSKI